MIAEVILRDKVVYKLSDRPSKYNLSYYTKHRIAALEQKGLITFLKRDGKKFIRLTEKGERELLKYRLKEPRHRFFSRWDGKWRIIIFDIKEVRRSARDRLRWELKGFGFRRLQNSVWVNPYPCEDFTILLKADLKLGRDVLYLEVEKIEGEKYLREMFNL